MDFFVHGQQEAYVKMVKMLVLLGLELKLVIVQEKKINIQIIVNGIVEQLV